MLSLKQIGILLLVVITTFAVVKTDLLTKARVKATNIFYGEQIRDVRGLRIVVESVSADLQNEGITPAAVREILISRLETGAIRVISEEGSQNTGSVAVLNVSLNGASIEKKRCRYMVIMEVHERKHHAAGLYQSSELIWSSARIGAGTSDDMEKALLSEADVLINANSGKI